MDGDRTMADPAKQPSPTSQAASARSACYVESAAPMDVMFEQLEYLVAHTRQRCSRGCLDCARLQQVERWLLRPFRANSRPRPSQRPNGARVHSGSKP